MGSPVDRVQRWFVFALAAALAACGGGAASSGGGGSTTVLPPSVAQPYAARTLVVPDLVPLKASNT